MRQGRKLRPIFLWGVLDTPQRTDRRFYERKTPLGAILWDSVAHVLTDRSFCPRQSLPIGEVLRKATGRPKHQERWGSREHGQNPFAQVWDVWNTGHFLFWPAGRLSVCRSLAELCLQLYNSTKGHLHRPQAIFRKTFVFLLRYEALGIIWTQQNALNTLKYNHETVNQRCSGSIVIVLFT